MTECICRGSSTALDIDRCPVHGTGRDDCYGPPRLEPGESAELTAEGGKVYLAEDIANAKSNSVSKAIAYGKAEDRATEAILGPVRDYPIKPGSGGVAEAVRLLHAALAILGARP